jgi:anti-sigma regulatory factor (Ser/Thr protein kinase)
MNKSYSQSFEITGNNFFGAGKAATEVKTILKQLGVNSEIVRRIAIASYEAEMNVVMYAKRASMNIEISQEKIKIVVDDEGPGIQNIELAMNEGYSTATREMREMGFGAGMGLPNIKRNADHLKIESEVGKGTKVEFVIKLKESAKGGSVEKWRMTNDG